MSLYYTFYVEFPGQDRSPQFWRLINIRETLNEFSCHYICKILTIPYKATLLELVTKFDRIIPNP